MTTTTSDLAFIEELAAEILAKRKFRLQSDIKVWPRSNTYASQVPSCVRQGFYAIKEWDKVKLHDPELQARFNKGKQEETNLIQELVSLGYEIVEQQVPLEKAMVQKYRLSGKIDGKIKYGGRRIPFEVKSMHPMSFSKVTTIADIKDDPFMVKYYRQMQVYLLGHNEPAGLFFLTDCLGHWKVIPVELNFDDAEQVLQTVEKINKHVDSGVVPDRIPYDSEVCGFCSFAHICLPDVVNEAIVKWENNPQVAKLLARLDELKPTHKEYESLYEECKTIFKDVPLAIVDKWTITGKLSKRKTYEIPDEIKGKYAKSADVWLMKIQKTDDGKREE